MGGLGRVIELLHTWQVVVVRQKFYHPRLVSLMFTILTVALAGVYLILYNLDVYEAAMRGLCAPLIVIAYSILIFHPLSMIITS